VWDKAARYLHQAGVKAAARSAYREAVGFFEQALKALEPLSETDDTRSLAIDIHVDMGPVLVARQAEAGPEAFCGMTRDAQYGPVLAVGAGGRAVEALALAEVTLAPVSPDEARSLVVGVPSLAGAAEGAREALARTLVALGRLALEHPEVAAVDVNPLILGADGAVAVDALVVVDRGGTG